MDHGADSRYADGYVIDVPYLPGFYPHLAPSSLNDVAMCNGVAPVSIHEPFAYLELGCGFGDTLLTLAAANPHGRFVGVDINPVHTGAIRQRVDRTGLTNVQVGESGFDALPANLAPQQFITMHGVFSWVADHVREQILAIAHDLLAPGGLLLVSYNALPGWAPLLPARRLIRELAEAAKGDSCQRVQAALAVAREMQGAGAPHFAQNPLAASMLEDVATYDPAYLAHEFLNDNWTAFAFPDVASRFHAAGLDYVGSLPLSNNLPALWPGAHLLRFLPHGDRVTAEARSDMLMNQSFRWDVYAKQPRRFRDAADRIAVTGGAGLRLTDASLALPWSTTVAGREMTLDGPPHDRIVALLRERPRTLAELVAALAADDPRANAGMILDDLDVALAVGVLRLDPQPLPPIEAPSVEARASHRYVVPDAFNRDVLSSLHGGVKSVTLASRRTGTGHGMRVLSAIVLASLADTASAHVESDMFLRSVDDRVTQRGLPLAVRSTGRPITDPGERYEAVQAICSDFMRIVLPELLQLGIVVSR
ncbi:MAG: methyltransferase regulatory domain-containing protein [Planctomycetaceae bacterium]